MVKSKNNFAKGDSVRITAKKEELLGIPEFYIKEIIKNPKGIIFEPMSDSCEVRTVLGIWTIKKKFLEYTEEKVCLSE